MITRDNYNVPELEHLILNEDKSNLCDFFAADTRVGRSFLQNDAGYPMNDIDVIIRQQDAKIQESLIRQLEEIPSSGVPADVSNAEVLLSLRSRYQQAPSEVVSWYERQIEILDSKRAFGGTNESFVESVSPSSVVDTV